MTSSCIPYCLYADILNSNAPIVTTVLGVSVLYLQKKCNIMYLRVCQSLVSLRLILTFCRSDNPSSNITLLRAVIFIQPACPSHTLSLHPPPHLTPGGRLLRLMLRSGALRSTDSELVQACIKGLTALFNLHNNRLAARADTRLLNKGKKAMKELNSLLPAGDVM